ncbi:hypothetical protein [Roseibium sp. MB-4]
MLSTDLIHYGYMCFTAAQTQEHDRLQEFTKRLGERLLEAAERAEGMEAKPAIIPFPTDHMAVDLSAENVIPFPKVRLRPVPSSDGGAA